MKEELPKDMPKPCGPGFTMRVFIYSDHAGDLVTQHSTTGFVVFLNSVPDIFSSQFTHNWEGFNHGLLGNFLR